MQQAHNALSFHDKWPPEVTSAGFIQIPNLLMRYQAELDLTKSELVVLINLMSFDYGSKKVEPAHSTLAKRIGMTSSAVRHNIASLESKGFIKRNYRQGMANIYDLLPIIGKLKTKSYEHPAKKRTGAYKNPGRLPPQITDTKEYYPKRHNKTESIKEILGNSNEGVII